MANVCENQLYATGTEQQIDLLKEKLSEVFDDNFDIDDNIVVGDEATLIASLTSKWDMPKDGLREVTTSIPDTFGMYIQVESTEPGCNYHEHSIFSTGEWSFDVYTTINAQILELKEKGLDMVRQFLQKEDVPYAIKEDKFWSVVYVDEYGVAECEFINCVETKNDSILLHLQNGHCIHENDLTTDHVLHMLTIIQNGDGEFKTTENK